MKKSIFLLLIVVASAAVLYSLYREEPQQWTTTSDEALQEFQLGREAVMRLYHEEARNRFNRALEIDSDFAAAKLMAYRVSAHERREALLEDLKQIELANLKPHEQFLIEWELAIANDDPEAAQGLLQDFAEAHPTNPWALEKQAELAWRRFDYDTAEEQYAKLLELEPNWVTAENNLGYIDISRGDFDAAEEHFRTYQYIAPDQANPHDSRGELLMLKGDYEGAWDEFATALEIRPDFCASYTHQMMAALLGGFDHQMPRVVERAREHCDPDYVKRLDCNVQVVTDYKQGNHQAWLGERDDDCLEVVKGNLFLHRMAVTAGEDEVAVSCESQMTEEGYKLTERGVGERNPVSGFALHLEGARLLAQKQPGKAAEKLQQADKHLFYMGDDLGLMKQLNLVELAIALEAAGDESAAADKLQEVTSVNPKMEGIYERRKQELGLGHDQA